MALERSLRTPDAPSTAARQQERSDRSQALACPLLAGRQIDGTPDANGVDTRGIIIAAGGQTVVNHKLGRAPAGLLLGRMLGPGQSSPLVVGQTDTTITFSNPSATAIAFAIWIY